MKKNSFTIFVSLLLGFLLLSSIQAQLISVPPTSEELKKQNEELKKQNEQLAEQIKLIEDNNALKAKLDSLPKGQILPKPTLTPPPNGNADGNSGGTPVSDVVSPIEGIKNLFTTKNNTIVNSVCEQQRLESANYNIYDKRICSLAKTLVKDTQVAGDKKITFKPGSINNSVAIFIIAKFAELQPKDVDINKDVRAFILDVENKRNDKQVGADSKSAGTTSLAVKGGIPQFLSWAVENGGAIGSKNGDTLTFRVNPLGLAENVSGSQLPKENNFDSLFKSGDGFSRVLRNFSIGFSFDITRGTDPPTFIGSKQQLSAVSARYNFINQKDPRNPIYKADWENFKKTYLDPYTEFADQLYANLVCKGGDETCDNGRYKNADLEKWRAETEVRLQTIDFSTGKSNIELVEMTRKILAEQINNLPIDKLKTDLTVISGVTKNGKELLSYSKAKKELQDKIAKGAIVTLEYTNYREVIAPNVSNFRFIAEKGLFADLNMTANASISFFNKMPTGMNVKRIRDFDFTLQLEKPLMELPFGKPIFSFSGQYQRLPGNIAALDGLVKPNTKGDIAAGQLKLTIPINGTGIKLPFSITFANRSELIKERTVRGNFGFTLDLDRLLLGRSLF